jgi:tetratricopeptide (TPR) repeat protein
MPRGSSNVNHVALTDHRIRRRPEPAAAGVLDPVDAAVRLRPFHPRSNDSNDPELSRDRAVAVIARARTQSDTVRVAVGRQLVPVLDLASGAHPDDLPARESLDVALAWQGDLDAALAACEATLAVAPNRELVLADAGLIAQRLGLNERSLSYWRRALAINPHSSRYRYEVANALAVRGDWPAAVNECRTVLAANGGHVPSRLLLMQHYWQTGVKDKARAELVAILALHPPNEAILKERFAEILR